MNPEDLNGKQKTKEIIDILREERIQGNKKLVLKLQQLIQL